MPHNATSGAAVEMNVDDVLRVLREIHVELINGLIPTERRSGAAVPQPDDQAFSISQG